MSGLTLTAFQRKVQEVVKQGKSVLLVAPTGLGKTLAVTADLQDKLTKTIYAVPLRALGVGIRDAIAELSRNGKPIEPVIHHGGTQESLLFSEEVIVTTYDQVVCGAPGLPLSLPLKAGHAVAAALLMSRLILDEAHLAWGISREALPILLGIVEFRQKLGLQTVLQTATMPRKVAKLIKERLELDEIVVVGDGEVTPSEDEGLALREKNRKLKASLIGLNLEGKGDNSKLSFQEVDTKLLKSDGKRICFCNTVGRLQETYDRLVEAGICPGTVTVLHNRMPRAWREQAEKQVRDRFGKGSPDGDWLLLTNQVAEAGLDISAPLVISDPAPVDTLVQRAGRCARWFRDGETRGDFLVLKAPNETERKRLALPYRYEFVEAALKAPNSNPFQKEELSWANECNWVDEAWGGSAKAALASVEEAIDKTAFALNLFDRAAQEHSPGTVASAFREILQIEVAVEDSAAPRDLQQLLDNRFYPETSSISLRRARSLLAKERTGCKIIRYEEGHIVAQPADSIQLGDVLALPSTAAYLHKAKGLCFLENGSVPEGPEVKTSSEWNKRDGKQDRQLSREDGNPQGLFEHTQEVMRGTYDRVIFEGPYRHTLIKILKSLEPGKDTTALANIIAQVATVAAGFHDLGKADTKWQAKAREIDPQSPDGLIGRTAHTGGRIGIPHTPPGFLATLKVCTMLMGHIDSAQHLVRSIALAAARHHSSLTNPALVEYTFKPEPKAMEFVQQVLKEVGASEEISRRADEILQAAQQIPDRELVPLALPNDDLFPIYALVGRAILMADRESAAGDELEEWEDRH